MTKLFRDYAANLMASVVVSLFSLLLYKLVLIVFGKADLELFSVIKRYQAFFIPIILLGYGVMLPKYIAQRKAGKKILYGSMITAVALWAVGLVLASVVDNTVFLALLFSFPAFLSGYFFSVSRGLEDYKKGIATMMLYLVILPLLAFIGSSEIKNYIYIYFYISVIVLGFWWRYYSKDFSLIAKMVSIELPIWTYLKRSWGRVPGDFCNQGVLIIPVQLLLMNDERQMAAYLSLAIAIAVACSIPIKPISTILLTRLASVKVDSRKNMLSVCMYILISAVIGSIYYILSVLINRFYFNDLMFLDVLRSLTLFVCFNSLYILIRSYIDALYDGPVLAYINGAGLAISLIVGVSGASGSFTLGFTFGCICLLTILAIAYKKS
ncbi:MAG: hypothetical protein WBF88_15645 [Pusillimonas sp.]